MKTITKLGLAAVLAFSLMPTAQAILLTPENALLSGEDNAQSAIEEYIANEGITLGTRVYEANPGATDVGAAAAWYSTVFGVLDVDPASAEITWEGPGKVTSNPTYFLIKDGNAQPNWYLHSVLGWDGMEAVYEI